MNMLNNIFALTKRNMLLFLKNKTTVFFSLLAPVLILVIYVAFMSDVQASMVLEGMPEGVAIDEKTVASAVNAWLVSGVVGIACITVGLNSMLSMVQDKENRAIYDFVASPLKPVNLLISYFLAAVAVTFCICLIVLLICITYIAVSTGVGFSFAEVAELLLILLLSCLSSVIIMMCVMSFFKTNAASTAFTGVFSALIGFITGAYFPLDMLPEVVQNFAALVPGTHSTSLFRNLFVGNIIESLPADVSPEFITELQKSYSFELNLFGAKIQSTYMYVFLAGSVLVFFGLYLVIDLFKRKRKNI